MSISIEKFIQSNNITQINISQALYNHKINIFQYIQFNEYSNIFENTLFWGMYNADEINKIAIHKGKAWVMWFKDDCNPIYKTRYNIVLQIAKLTNVAHILFLNNMVFLVNC